MKELIKVGAKVRKYEWKDNHFLFITAVGEETFLAKHSVNYPSFETIFMIRDDWELYEEPKKKVMMYPALLITNASDSKTGYLVTESLFETEKEAKDRYTYTFVKLLTDRGIEVEQ